MSRDDSATYTDADFFNVCSFLPSNKGSYIVGDRIYVAAVMNNKSQYKEQNKIIRSYYIQYYSYKNLIPIIMTWHS